MAVFFDIWLAIWQLIAYISPDGNQAIINFQAHCARRVE